MAVETFPAYAAFEKQLRTLCLKEFPCGAGNWVRNNSFAVSADMQQLQCKCFQYKFIDIADDALHRTAERKQWKMYCYVSGIGPFWPNIIVIAL